MCLPLHDKSQGCEFLDDALRNESLSEVLTDLQRKGYNVDLNFETHIFALYGGDLDMRLNPDAFHVDEIDQAGSSDKDSVYAISTSAGVKGIIVDDQET